MTIVDFEKIVRSDAVAERYLLDRIEEIEAIRCPACGGEKMYLIEGGARRRCASCRHTFSPFAGRRLHGVKIAPRKWLWIVKLFELERPATVIASETGVSYPTVLKAIDILRDSLAEPRPLDCPGGAGRCAARDASAAAWMPFPAEGEGADGLRYATAFGRDCLILADRNVPYPSLSCRGLRFETVDRGRHFPHLRAYCSSKGFWPFAKERLAKYHGIASEKLPLYLNEMISRWMNRGTPIFELLIDRLAGYAYPQLHVKEPHLEPPRCASSELLV